MSVLIGFISSIQASLSKAHYIGLECAVFNYIKTLKSTQRPSKTLETTRSLDQRRRWRKRAISSRANRRRRQLPQIAMEKPFKLAKVILTRIPNDLWFFSDFHCLLVVLTGRRYMKPSKTTKESDTDRVLFSFLTNLP